VSREQQQYGGGLSAWLISPLAMCWVRPVSHFGSV